MGVTGFAGAKELDACAMHRFRINICASDSAAARVADDLTEAGGLPIGPREPSCWVWSTDEGEDAILGLSRRFPAVMLAVEGFEDFDQHLHSSLVMDGEASNQNTRNVLANGWGSYHEEDGSTLDAGLLRRAGAVIASKPDEHDGRPLLNGLDVSLVVAEELGRFAGESRGHLDVEAPTARTLDAVARLGRLAWRASTVGRIRTPGESHYLRWLRLTQSVIHAGISEYEAGPGEAEWSWWINVLLGSASDLIDAAGRWELMPAGPDPALLPGVELPDSADTMEMAARSTLTSCVEAIALFGASHPSQSSPD